MPAASRLHRSACCSLTCACICCQAFGHTLHCSTTRTMMHVTTTDSLEHDKRSHQTNNRRFKPVPVRTHHSHTRTNSRSSVVATEHTPAN